MFNLFSDTNLLVNAKFALPKIEESHLLVNSSTFIEQLGFSIRHPITHMLTKAKISALDHSILVGDNFIIVEDHPIT